MLVPLPVLERELEAANASLAELQGESLAFAPDGSGYLTVSEGEYSTLHRTG